MRLETPHKKGYRATPTESPRLKSWAFSRQKSVKIINIEVGIYLKNWNWTHPPYEEFKIFQHIRPFHSFHEDNCIFFQSNQQKQDHIAKVAFLVEESLFLRITYMYPL
jgi:hypothetical protein